MRSNNKVFSKRLHNIENLTFISIDYGYSGSETVSFHKLLDRNARGQKTGDKLSNVKIEINCDALTKFFTDPQEIGGVEIDGVKDSSQRITPDKLMHFLAAGTKNCSGIVLSLDNLFFKSDLAVNKAMQIIQNLKSTATSLTVIFQKPEQKGADILEDVEASENAKMLFNKLFENDAVLSKIDFRFQKMEMTTAKSIAEAIKQNDSLTEVALRTFEDSCHELKEILPALKENKSISRLTLQDPNIGSLGQELAHFLKNNETLLELKTSSFQFRLNSDFLKILRKSLSCFDDGDKNKTLRALDISGRSIQHWQATLIEDIITQNVHLTKMIIEENGVDFKLESFERAVFVTNSARKVLGMEMLVLENLQGKKLVLSDELERKYSDYETQRMINHLIEKNRVPGKSPNDPTNASSASKRSHVEDRR